MVEVSPRSASIDLPRLQQSPEVHNLINLRVNDTSRERRVNTLAFGSESGNQLRNPDLLDNSLNTEERREYELTGLYRGRLLGI